MKAIEESVKPSSPPFKVRPKMKSASRDIDLDKIDPAKKNSSVEMSGKSYSPSSPTKVLSVHTAILNPPEPRECQKSEMTPTTFVPSPTKTSPTAALDASASAYVSPISRERICLKSNDFLPMRKQHTDNPYDFLMMKRSKSWGKDVLLSSSITATAEEASEKNADVEPAAPQGHVNSEMNGLLEDTPTNVVDDPSFIMPEEEKSQKEVKTNSPSVEDSTADVTCKNSNILEAKREPTAEKPVYATRPKTVRGACFYEDNPPLFPGEEETLTLECQSGKQTAKGLVENTTKPNDMVEKSKTPEIGIQAIADAKSPENGMRHKTVSGLSFDQDSPPTTEKKDTLQIVHGRGMIAKSFSASKPKLPNKFSMEGASCLARPAGRGNAATEVKKREEATTGEEGARTLFTGTYHQVVLDGRNVKVQGAWLTREKLVNEVGKPEYAGRPELVRGLSCEDVVDEGGAKLVERSEEGSGPTFLTKLRQTPRRGFLFETD